LYLLFLYHFLNLTPTQYLIHHRARFDQLHGRLNLHFLVKDHLHQRRPHRKSYQLARLIIYMAHQTVRERDPFLGRQVRRQVRPLARDFWVGEAVSDHFELDAIHDNEHFFHRVALVQLHVVLRVDILQAQTVFEDGVQPFKVPSTQGVVLFFFGAFVAVDGFHVVRVLCCELLFVLLFQF